MKKLLKLTVSLFVCGAFLLTGCTTSTTSLPGDLTGLSIAYPEAVNIRANEFFAVIDQENTEEIQQQWLDELSERYGTTFNITSACTIYSGDDSVRSTMNSDINSILYGQTEFGGLVQIDSFKSLQTAIDNNVVMPLDDYLAKNPIWKTLPESLKSTFAYNGHIYAIPTTVSRSTAFSRYITKTALEQTGINVTDLASLKNLALTYTQMTGNYALSSFGLGDLQDILNVYGLYYTQEYYSHPFAYDPSEGCFVDFLTKDASISALQYLRELYAGGALDINFDYSYWREDAQTDQYASGGFFDRNETSEKVSLNSSYPQVLKNDISGFAMTIGTSQPQETVNLFVDMMFGSEQNYLQCWLGSPDNYILNSDGTITVKMVQNADGRYVIPSTPGLTGGLSDIFPYSDASIIYTKDGVAADEFWAGGENKKTELIKQMIAEGKAVIVPPAFSLINSPAFNTAQTISWTTRKGSVTYLFENCIMDAITDTDYTVQQIIEQYRLDMLSIGGNAMLDEMNAAIGKKTAYYTVE